MRAGLVCLALLVLLAPAVYGEEDEVAAWLRQDPRAAAYRDFEPALSRMVSEATAAGVPPALLLDKLREGAAKGVAPDRLTSGLVSEVARLQAAALILRRQDAVPTDQRQYQDMLRNLSYAQAAGIGVQTLESLFATARGLGRPALEAIAACNALIQMRSLSKLSDEDLRRLGDAILSSRQPASAFRSIPPLYLKARAAGLSESEILDSVIVDTLRHGGGLVQMEEQIRTKRKGR